MKLLLLIAFRYLVYAIQALCAWIFVSTLILGAYAWNVIYKTQYKNELQCFTALASDTDDREAWAMAVPEKKKK